MSKFSKLLGILFLAALAGCSSKEAIRTALLEDPEMVYQAIEKNPERFAQVMKDMETKLQVAEQTKAHAEEKARMEAELKNPAKTTIDSERAFRGELDAPIQVIEYSDFQCPYCKKGYLTVEALRKKYGKKVVFVFKHLPLTQIHPLALPAAKHFEAIALQSKEKAYRFHDELFANQEKLSEKYMTEVAKKVGANLTQMRKDLESQVVLDRIEADEQEARKLGLTGTPAFVVSGVTIRGAYPIKAFESILEKRGLNSVN